MRSIVRSFFTKSIVLVAAAFTLSACENLQGSPSIVSACTATVNAYAHARDSVDPVQYGALFTEDASFTIWGQTMRSREAIVEALIDRGGQLATRHITGSIHVTPTSSSTATGRSYALVLAPQENETLPEAELSGESFFAMATYEDAYEIDGAICKFQRRKVTVEFERSKP